MTILLLALALAATTMAVIRTIHTDGHGTRPPPRSHRGDDFDPGRAP